MGQGSAAFCRPESEDVNELMFCGRLCPCAADSKVEVAPGSRVGGGDLSCVDAAAAFASGRRLMSGTGGTDESIFSDDATESAARAAASAGGAAASATSSGLAGMATSTTTGQSAAGAASGGVRRAETRGFGKAFGWKSQESDEDDAVNQYAVSLGNLLDCFSICGRSVPVLRASLDAALMARGVNPESERVSAVAKVVKASVGSSLSEAELEPNIIANIKNVCPLRPELSELARLILQHSEVWVFDGSGRIDAAPRLKDARLANVHVSQETVADLRRLACPHVPLSKQKYSLVRELRTQQFSTSRSSTEPEVIITVGPPGSGKTFLLHSRCIEFMSEKFDAPPREDYIALDPDYFISHLLDNNNDLREMANFLNHESFMCAVGQRRHVLFDHTGKDLINTCGRVISRFKEANYKVRLCVILADYATCRRRSDDRLRLTGRGVAEEYTRLVFEALQKTVPWYLQNHATIADTVAVFYNDYSSASEAPEILGASSDMASVLARAQASLALPPLNEDVPSPAAVPLPVAPAAVAAAGARRGSKKR